MGDDAKASDPPIKEGQRGNHVESSRLSREFLNEETTHRRLVTKLVHGIWTQNGTDMAGLAEPLLSMKVDALGKYMMLILDEDNDDFPALSEDLEEKIIGQNHADRDDIDRVTARDLTYEQFFERYMEPHIPVMFLPDLVQNWPARTEWVIDADNGGSPSRIPNVDQLKQHYGSDVVTVHEQYLPNQQTTTINTPKKLEMTVAEYVDWWTLYHHREQIEEEKKEPPKVIPTNYASGEQHEPLLYLKDWKFMARRRHIYTNSQHPLNSKPPYTCPTYFSDDYLNDSMNAAYQFVYLGPAGTSTKLHEDVLRSYSWSTNVCGQKRWYLIPPQYTYLLYDGFGQRLATHLFADLELGGPQGGGAVFYPGLAKARRFLSGRSNAEGSLGKADRILHVIQQDGETIFVPSGWHHTVENLRPTLSINHNWINATNIGQSWAKLKMEMDAYHRAMSDKWKGQKGEELLVCADNENGGQSQDDRQMGQIGDDLFLLWILLSSKAREILSDYKQTAKEAEQNDAAYNLRQILPILEEMRRLIDKEGCYDFGLGGRVGESPGDSGRCVGRLTDAVKEVLKDLAAV